MSVPNASPDSEEFEFRGWADLSVHCRMLAERCQTVHDDEDDYAAENERLCERHRQHA